MMRSAARRLSGVIQHHPAAQLTVLPNGVRVVTQKTHDPVASVGCYLDAGSRLGSVQGVGALLHESSLLGTKNFSGGKLAQAAEDLGSSINTEFGREITSYSLNVDKADVSQALNIVGDIVANPELKPDNVEKARAQLLHNLEHDPRSFEEVMIDRLHMSCFRDSSLGFSLLGNQQGLTSLTVPQLQERSQIGSDRIVVSAVGDVDHAAIVKQAEGLFGGMKKSAPREIEKPYFLGAELNYRNDEMGRFVHLSMGYEAVPAQASSAITFDLMAAITGDFVRDMGPVPDKLSANRTVARIAHKQAVGAAEEYTTFNLKYKDTGLFGFYIRTDEVAIKCGSEELIFSFQLMAAALQEEELDRSKRELMAKYSQQQESCSNWADRTAKQVIYYNRVMSAQEYLHRINAHTVGEINRVAYEKLADSELSFAVLGPTHGVPQLYDYRRMNTLYRY